MYKGLHSKGIGQVMLRRIRPGMTSLTAVLAALLLGAAVLLAACGGDDGSPSPSASPADSASPAATVTEDANDDGQASLVSEDCLTAVEIYENVRPSVVEISVITVTNGFFGQQEGQATGTGIVLDEDGNILTNYHVAGNGETIEVRFSDGEVVEAQLIGSDPANDLAVIRVDPLDHDLEPATLGDSEEIRVGEWVLAIGSPFNLEGTLTQGIVSGLDRTYSSGNSTRPIRGLIQTDAAVNPGNSGGPLLNCLGEVIGVNTLIENPTGDRVNVGVAFAVPISAAEAGLDEMIAGQEVQHAWLGIAGQDVTPGLDQALNLGTDSGVYVTLVTDGSPADLAGIVPAFTSPEQAQGVETPPPGGDVIVSADGEDMDGIEELAEYLALNTRPGESVQLEVVRDGVTITVEAVLADWPEG